MRDFLIMKCFGSTTPLAWELYGDMMDPIFFAEVHCCSYKHGTIVGDDFCHATPLAEDIFKYEVTKGLLYFLRKWVLLGP